MLLRLIIPWSVFSVVTADYGENEPLAFTPSDTWRQCLGHLSTEKTSPANGSILVQNESVCRLWRPRVLGGPAHPSPQTPCVFSHAASHDDAGLSLVTTYETMYDLLSHGTLDETDQGVPESALLSAGTPMLEPAENHEDGTPAYEVRTLPGRGQGIIALRHIKQNETLLLDRPAVLISWDLIGMTWTQTQESFLDAAVQSLPEHTRNSVLGLSSAHLVPHLPLCDIFKTNICGLFLGSSDIGTPHLGLYPEFARINHACAPNAFYRVSPRTLVIEVVAFRDIEPGEEIYINYSPHAMPYQDRRQYLQEEYGFTCNCSLCSLPRAQRDTSDQYRVDLGVLRDAISLAERQRRWEDVVQHASEIVETLPVAEDLGAGVKDYSLTELYMNHLEDLAESYFRMGNVDVAKHFAERALDVTLYLRGVHSHDAQQLRKFLIEIQTE